MSATKWSPYRAGFAMSAGIAGLAAIAFLTTTGVGQVDTDEEVERVRPGVQRQAKTLFYTGKVSKIEDGKVTVVLDDTEQEIFSVSEDTQILLDGKPAKLEDLRSTDVVKVTSDVGRRNQADTIVAARTERVINEDQGEVMRQQSRQAGQQQQQRRQGQQQRSGTQQQTQQGIQPLWAQGRMFVAPLYTRSAAAQAGFRPGDIIILVDSNQALGPGSLDQLQGLRILSTANTPAMVIDPRLGAAFNRVDGFGNAIAPGTVGSGFVPTGQFNGGLNQVPNQQQNPNQQQQNPNQQNPHQQPGTQPNQPTPGGQGIRTDPNVGPNDPNGPLIDDRRATGAEGATGTGGQATPAAPGSGGAPQQ